MTKLESPRNVTLGGRRPSPAEPEPGLASGFDVPEVMRQPPLSGGLISRQNMPS
jgi:hypothetical protein